MNPVYPVHPLHPVYRCQPLAALSCSFALFIVPLQDFIHGVYFLPDAVASPITLWPLMPFTVHRCHFRAGRLAPSSVLTACAAHSPTAAEAHACVRERRRYACATAFFQFSQPFFMSGTGLSGLSSYSMTMGPLNFIALSAFATATRSISPSPRICSLPP